MTDRELRLFCLEQCAGDALKAQDAYKWLSNSKADLSPHTEQLIELIEEGKIKNPVDLLTSKGERWVFFSSKVGWELSTESASKVGGNGNGSD